MGSGPTGGAATTIAIQAGDVDSVLGLFPLHAWLLPMLVAGVCLGLLRLAVGFLRLSHYRRAALRMATLPAALREALALVRVAPAFFLSDRVGSPVTFGWLKPAIIFPRRFERMEESHQRAIACHELLHVARCDWLVNLCEEFILTFFWFHPAIWWVMRSIRLAREQVVDCQVVALTGARKPYLHALLEIATARRVMPVPAPLFLVESQLARRVASLVKEVRMSKPRLIASLVIALAVLAATGWWAVRTFWFIAPLPSQTLVSYGSFSPPGSNAPPKTLVVYTVGDDIKAPVPIYKPEPPYTNEARAAKLEGTSEFWAIVDASGNIADVRLVRSVGMGLDESAMQTMRTWKFAPATKHGKPVPVRVIVQVSFRIF
jgi:TonB family protein